MEAERYQITQFGRPTRKPGDRHTFTYYLPEPVPRELTLDLETVRLLAEAENALGHLEGLGRLLPQSDLLVGPFLTREALASSRIEGTNATLTEVLRAEEVEAPRNDDIAEVARYLAATRCGLDLIK